MNGELYMTERARRSFVRKPPFADREKEDAWHLFFSHCRRSHCSPTRRSDKPSSPPATIAATEAISDLPPGRSGRR